jgi:hypothetical protein
MACANTVGDHWTMVPSFLRQATSSVDHFFPWAASTRVSLGWTWLQLTFSWSTKPTLPSAGQDLAVADAPAIDVAVPVGVVEGTQKKVVMARLRS